MISRLAEDVLSIPTVRDKMESFECSWIGERISNRRGGEAVSRDVSHALEVACEGFDLREAPLLNGMNPQGLPRTLL